MPTLMTGIAGIRGVIGDGLSPEVVARYGAAFGTFLKGGKVVVGGDTRQSRHMVRSALFAGLTATGCEVIDLNLATTPTVELMVAHLGAAGGVCVTASHNPVAWNAMKFLDQRGRFLGPEQGSEVNRIFEEGTFDYADTQHLGKVIVRKNGGVDYHIKAVLDNEFIDVSAIRRNQFRVALDGVNSVGNLIVPNLLHDLGCDLRKVHGDLSGEFGREAEPVPENLGDLCELVNSEGMDIGFALDPDGDRLAIVNENGQPIGEELTLALAVKHVLALRKGPVVINFSTSRATEEIARAAGVDVYRTPVGEAHVAAEMDRVGAIVGGEGNGGVMLPAVHANRDALVGIGLVLSMLATNGEPLSVLVSRLPQYSLIKRKAPAAGLNPGGIRERIRGAFPDPQGVDERDGIRVDLEHAWVHVRPSNTEPIVRIFAEAKSKQAAHELAERAIAAVKGEEA
ncbi:MAG: Phosphoglucosamine mutase [Calditrichaeota bacterium]|nr:Phosphoglucosamine mutase [Calditrichota bacterium]